MKSEVNIRFARQEDAEMLAELGRETFYDAFVSNPLMLRADLELYLKDAFSVSQITGELNDPQATFLLVEIDVQAVGYAKLILGACEPGGVTRNPVKLKRLYAWQEFIGIGIRAGLLSRCLIEARKIGNDAIWLTVWEYNRRTRDFYRKWNFKP